MYNTNYFSFFLSFEKFCYCLPIELPPSITTTAIRKPLVHCSFLPDVKNAYNNSFNATSVHPNTVVKINVQRYCSSSFVFDRTLYQCRKIIVINESNTHSKPTANDTCSPISVRTIEQYEHLLSLAPPAPSRTYIWINRNSTYLLDDLFKGNGDLSSSEDLCLVIDRALSLSANLVPCSNAHPSDYIFCAQKQIKIIDDDQSESQSIETTPILNDVTCPAGFILFDNLCYYVDLTIANNTETGQKVCSDKYANSTLVKFNSHELGNVKAGRILDRTLNDVLLELFYYQLEKKLNNEGKSSNEWPRLLIGDKDDGNRCMLRYFTRSTGGFNISSSCNQGGNPVCQFQPTLIKNTVPNPSNAVIEPEPTTEETPDPATEETPDPATEETPDPVSTSDAIFIGDLGNNATIIDDYNYTSPENIMSSSENQRSKQNGVTIVVIAIFCVTLLAGIIFLVYHRRQHRGIFHFNGIQNRSNSQTKDTTTPVIVDQRSNSTAVLYTAVETSEPSVLIDPDVIKSSDENSHAIIKVSNESS